MCSKRMISFINPTLYPSLYFQQKVTELTPLHPFCHSLNQCETKRFKQASFCMQPSIFFLVSLWPTNYYLLGFFKTSLLDYCGRWFVNLRNWFIHIRYNIFRGAGFEANKHNIEKSISGDSVGKSKSNSPFRFDSKLDAFNTPK